MKTQKRSDARKYNIFSCLASKTSQAALPTSIERRHPSKPGESNNLRTGYEIRNRNNVDFLTIASSPHIFVRHFTNVAHNWYEKSTALGTSSSIAWAANCRNNLRWTQRIKWFYFKLINCQKLLKLVILISYQNNP